ncbi:RHS repeat-associated core domain-containing protein [Dysgonomonas sp. 521]|nr:RHS repeat-associated core domain-containing protein [Dysgonomonas sp. 521]
MNDHLGNNRVVANASGTLVQRNHYYPFGSVFASTTGAGKQPYKYNGKELDAMHGVNLYDYSARYMDSQIGRFTSVDPLAEEYYSWSPYSYGYNNPLRHVDPTGEGPIDAIKGFIHGLLSHDPNKPLSDQDYSLNTFNQKTDAERVSSDNSDYETGRTVGVVTSEIMDFIVPGGGGKKAVKYGSKLGKKVPKAAKKLEKAIENLDDVAENVVKKEKPTRNERIANKKKRKNRLKIKNKSL